MGRAKAELPGKMRPYDQSTLVRETLVGEPDPDERGNSGSVNFHPQCRVRLLPVHRDIVFVHTTNAARQCTQIRTESFRLG